MHAWKKLPATNTLAFAQSVNDIPQPQMLDIENKLDHLSWLVIFIF